MFLGGGQSTMAYTQSIETLEFHSSKLIVRINEGELVLIDKKRSPEKEEIIPFSRIINVTTEPQGCALFPRKPKTVLQYKNSYTGNDSTFILSGNFNATSDVIRDTILALVKGSDNPGIYCHSEPEITFTMRKPFILIPISLFPITLFSASLYLIIRGFRTENFFSLMWISLWMCMSAYCAFMLISFILADKSRVKLTIYGDRILYTADTMPRKGSSKKIILFSDIRGVLMENRRVSYASGQTIPTVGVGFDAHNNSSAETKSSIEDYEIFWIPSAFTSDALVIRSILKRVLFQYKQGFDGGG
jgi:hypothetical protein